VAIFFTIIKDEPHSDAVWQERRPALLAAQSNFEMARSSSSIANRHDSDQRQRWWHDGANFAEL